jgi:hypothetical protein
MTKIWKPYSQPKFDKYGLHSEGCECVRCSLGHRPSEALRGRLARDAKKRGEQKAVETKESKKNERIYARADRAIRETEKWIEGVAFYPPIPPGFEELNRLREEAGLPKRRKR